MTAFDLQEKEEVPQEKEITVKPLHVTLPNFKNVTVWNNAKGKLRGRKVKFQAVASHQYKKYDSENP